MPRPRTPEGELTPAARRILATVDELFYERGIRAVGVEEIAETAGVTKKTLYDTFGSKDALVVAYLRDRDRQWRAWLGTYVEQHATTPMDKLLATFDALAEWLRRDHARGCAFVNANAEFPDRDHPAQAVIAEDKRWVRDYLSSLAGDAGLPDPHHVADQLMILHEGVTVTQSLDVVPQATGCAKDLARLALQSKTDAVGPT